jgi:negative regulator of flagellin synthesis FlgM
MRIDPGSVQPVGPRKATGADAAQGADKAQKAGAASEAEAVAAAAEAQAAAQAVAAAPDVRVDRIAELRARLERGEFKVDAQRVADGIIRGG